MIRLDLPICQPHYEPVQAKVHSHEGGPKGPGCRCERNVGTLRANGVAMSGQGGCGMFSAGTPASYSLQLLSARVSVQTLTEHGLNREGRVAIRVT